MVYCPLASIFTFQLAKDMHITILLHCVLGFYYCDLKKKKALTKSSMEKTGFTWFTFPSRSPSLKKAKAQTQAGT